MYKHSIYIPPDRRQGLDAISSRMAETCGYRISRAAGLSVDQQVEVAVEGDRIVLTPVRNRTLTLEERLAHFDPDRHGGEAMSVSEPLGNERF